MAIPNKIESLEASKFVESSVVPGQPCVAIVNPDGTNAGLPAFSTVACGELQGAASATQLPTVSCKMVKFKARANNSGNVYIGKSAVTLPDGTTDTTTGIELSPGDDSGWLPVTNLNIFYRICDNAGDDLTYIALS